MSKDNEFFDDGTATESESRDEIIEEDDIIEEDEDTGPRISIFTRLVALVTVLIFAGLIFIVAWSSMNINTPLGELVLGSLSLKKEVDHRLMEAVTKIEVVAQRPDSGIAVEQRSGTGFNVHPSGVIITNHHVIEGALNITVTFPDGKRYAARTWNSRPEYDLAVVSLRRDGLPVVPLNTDSPDLPGHKLLVVGNPLGLNNIVVEGEFKQYLKLKDKPDVVFSFDAPVYPGNSGSPVFDSGGRVVGVVFGSLHQEGEGEESILGLAVPIMEIMELIQ